MKMTLAAMALAAAFMSTSVNAEETADTACDAALFHLDVNLKTRGIFVGMTYFDCSRIEQPEPGVWRVEGKYQTTALPKPEPFRVVIVETPIHAFFGVCELILPPSRNLVDPKHAQCSPTPSGETAFLGELPGFLVDPLA